MPAQNLARWPNRPFMCQKSCHIVWTLANEKSAQIQQVGWIYYEPLANQIQHMYYMYWPIRNLLSHLTALQTNGQSDPTYVSYRPIRNLLGRLTVLQTNGASDPTYVLYRPIRNLLGHLTALRTNGQSDPTYVLYWLIRNLLGHLTALPNHWPIGNQKHLGEFKI
jgi:hypothetical protein